MGKGVKTDFQEVLAMEDEFKCYLRPVIEDEETGWSFVAGNINPQIKTIYPKIYQLHQFIQTDKRQRQEWSRYKKK